MNYRFYQHRSCEFFPCHTGIDPEQFNCLFCYCPLYLMGKDCGGKFYYRDSGVKVCSDCIFPHVRDHYDLVLKRIKDHIGSKRSD